MAAMVALGLSLPEAQAGPELTITPARSMAIICKVFSKPGVAKPRVWGRRATAAPSTTAPAASTRAFCA